MACEVCTEFFNLWSQAVNVQYRLDPRTYTYMYVSSSLCCYLTALPTSHAAQGKASSEPRRRGRGMRSRLMSEYGSSDFIPGCGDPEGNQIEQGVDTCPHTCTCAPPALYHHYLHRPDSLFRSAWPSAPSSQRSRLLYTQHRD